MMRTRDFQLNDHESENEIEDVSMVYIDVCMYVYM